MARRYAISSIHEARAYLAHPILGPRLRECTQLMLAAQGRTSRQLLGDIDSQKFRSSITLFARATPEDRLFQDALDKYFDGEADEAALLKLEARN
jgi:uncharacterized protein (DUF1810 family)